MTPEQQPPLGMVVYLPYQPDAPRAEPPTGKWMERVRAVVDQAHAENWGGKHRTGFCEACADAYIVAQHAVPEDPT